MAAEVFLGLKILIGSQANPVTYLSVMRTTPGTGFTKRLKSDLTLRPPFSDKIPKYATLRMCGCENESDAADLKWQVDCSDHTQRIPLALETVFKT